jgi:hypothetical protein
MRKIIRASVLVLALAIPAFAGDIPNDVIGYIPNGVASTGNIPNDITSASPQASIAEAWISLFFSLIQ